MVQFNTILCAAVLIHFHCLRTASVEIAAVPVNPKSSPWTRVTLWWRSDSTAPPSSRVARSVHCDCVFPCYSVPRFCLPAFYASRSNKIMEESSSPEVFHYFWRCQRSLLWSKILQPRKKGKLCVSLARSTVAKISWLKTWLLHSSVRHFSCYYY